MLPSTPLHHLLLADGPPLLVMTSGNLADEPIARDDDEALARARRHRRRVPRARSRRSTRAPTTRWCASSPARRSRCGARAASCPSAIALPFAAPPVLARRRRSCKSTVCLTRGGDAFSRSTSATSTHRRAARVLRGGDRQARARCSASRPSVVAHDLHPDYRSTRWALASARCRASPCSTTTRTSPRASPSTAARAASSASRSTAPAAAPDGELWGGEFLVADLGGFARVGHLRAVRAARRRGGDPRAVAPRASPRCSTPASRSTCSRASPRARRARRARLLERRRCLAARDRRRPLVRRGRRAARRARRRSATRARRRSSSRRSPAPGAHEPLPVRASTRRRRRSTIDLRPDDPRARRATSRAARPRAIARRRASTRRWRVVDRAAAARARATGLDTVALSGGCFQNRRLTERAHARCSPPTASRCSCTAACRRTTAASRSARPRSRRFGCAQGGDRCVSAFPVRSSRSARTTACAFAKVRFGGITREVCLECQPDAVVGDFVLVHVGFAIARIDATRRRAPGDVLERIGETDELADAPRRSCA